MPHKTQLIACLAAVIGLVLPLHAKIIWQEDFESARCLLDWKQTARDKPTQEVFLRSDTIAHTGKASGMVHALFGEEVYIEKELPENKGGVLTVWVYDPGYEYSGINMWVKVRDQKDQEIHSLLACGHFEFVANGVMLRPPFLYRRNPLQWYCFQFVLGPADKGQIQSYIDGRLASVGRHGSQSFKSIKLGSHMLRGKIFYDAITLDDDPAAIETFKGCDVQISAPRLGRVVYDDDTNITATVLCRNYSLQPIAGELSGNLVDGDGKVWTEIAPVSLAVPAVSNVTGLAIAYPVPPRKGRFYLQAFAKQGGKLIGQTRIPVAVTFNPAAIGKYDGPFGIQGIGSMSRSGMKNIGARCYNLILSWPNSEPAPGKMEWDKHLEEMIRVGVDDKSALLMLNFAQPPKWYQAGGEWNPAVPKNDKDLEDFAGKAAKYYRETYNVNYWSYCEEPAGYFPWPRYMEMFQAAVKGIRAGNPEAKIVGLNAVTADYSFDEWMFKHGAGKFMDIYGHHFYCNGRPEDYKLVEKLNMVKDFMRQYNEGKVLPIWDTECGLYVAGLGKGLVPLTPEQVARYKAMGWYQDYYFADSDAANFTARKMVLGYANGLTKYFFHKSLRRFDGTYTLTALAVSALAHELSGAGFVKNIDFGSKNIHGYVFVRDGRYFGAFWTTRNTADVTLKLEKPEYILMDRFGNQEQKTAGAGNLLHLSLSETPIYLLGITAGMERQPDMLSLTCPEKVETPSFKVTVSALAGVQLAGDLALKLPEGWSSHPERVACDFGKISNVTFTVDVPRDVLKGDQVITAGLNDKSGKCLFSAQGEVTLAIAAPCRYLEKPIVLDGNLDDWPNSIQPLLVNRLDQVVAGRPAVEDTQTLGYQISQGSRFWKGPDDLSAEVKAAWDDTNVYIGIRVKDKILLNDFMRNPYQGDSIEMFLDTRPADQGFGRPVYGDGVYHLRFVPPVNGDKEGRQVGYFTKTEDSLLRRRPEFIIRSGEKVYSDGKGHLRNREIPAYAATRFVYNVTGEGYTVEFAIPFAIFMNGRPKPGETFGFDLMFNDQDYPKEVSAVSLCWYGNGKNSTNPSVFGKLRLVK